MGILKGLAVVVGVVSGGILGLAVVGLMVKGLGEYGLQSFLLFVAIGGIGMGAAVVLDRGGRS